MRTLLIVAVLVLGSSLSSANPTVVIPDASAPLGASVVCPVQMQTVGSTGFVMDVHWDSNALNLVNLNIGSGLQQWIATNGMPPTCDIFEFPNFVRVIMTFAPLYDSAIYGEEMLRLRFQTQQLGATDVYTSGTPASIVTTGTVTVDNPAPQFIRGDINNDQGCDISDAILLLGHLFQQQPSPDCNVAKDVNSDGSVNLTDVVALLGFVFGTGGPTLPEVCEPVSGNALLSCNASGCP